MPSKKKQQPLLPERPIFGIPQHVLGLSLYRMDRGIQDRVSFGFDEVRGGALATAGTAAKTGRGGRPLDLIHRNKSPNLGPMRVPARFGGGQEEAYEPIKSCF